MNTVYILHLLAQYGYLIIFFFIFIQECGIGLPIPSEILLLFAGYQVSAQGMGLFHTLLTGVAADFLGAIILYSLCTKFKSFTLPLMKKLFKVNMAKIEMFEAGIRKHGMVYILFGRIIPYVRYYATLTAGLTDIPFRVFLVSAFIGSICWVSTFTLTGLFLGKRVVYAASFIQNMNSLSKYAFLVVVIVFLIGYIIWQRRMRLLKNLNLADLENQQQS